MRGREGGGSPPDEVLVGVLLPPPAEEEELVRGRQRRWPAGPLGQAKHRAARRLHPGRQPAGPQEVDEGRGAGEDLRERGGTREELVEGERVRV